MVLKMDSQTSTEMISGPIWVMEVSFAGKMIREVTSSPNVENSPVPFTLRNRIVDAVNVDIFCFCIFFLLEGSQESKKKDLLQYFTFILVS